MAGTLGTIMGQVRLDVRQAVASYAALRAQNQRTVYAMRGTGDSFVAAGQRMTIAGAGIVFAFSKMVMAAAEFERKMDFFGAVQKTSAKEMAALKNEILDLAKTSIYSADAIADGVVELGKAGVDAAMIMEGLGQAMVNLGAAGDIPLEEAGRMITSTLQQFNLEANRSVDVVDMLAGSANASIVDIADLGVSLKYVGGVASAVGLDFEDTLTAISLLGKAGIRGSTAGTSLRQMLVSLGGATGPARESLAELGIITEDGGNKFFTAEGKAKSLSKVFQILQDSTSDLTQKQRLMHLRTIFNNRALSAASILTREGSKGFKEMYREMSKVSAADVASQRLDNLSGDLEILRSNIDSMLIRAGGPFQKTMRKWVQVITGLVQAFDELDPATQEMIIQSVAISGAVLIAMGVFSMIIGTIFRFIAATMKMGAGVKFLYKLLKILVVNARWAAVLFGGPLVAALGAITAPIWAAIAAVAAIGIALVIAYKKSETFRNMINRLASALWDGLKAIGGFFKALATDPGAVWDSIKQGAQDMLTTIVNGFKRLPSLMGQGLSAAASAVGGFIGRVVSYFLSLPGRVLGALAGFVAQVASLFTFRNIGYALGFLLGTVVRFFMTMGLRMAALALTAVSKVISFFSRLPGRIGFLIGFMAGRAIGLMIRFGARMIAGAARLVSGVINFMSKLPGRVAAFMSRMASRGISLMISFATKAPALAAQMVSSVIGFISRLPGRVGAFIGNMTSRARTLFSQMKTQAVRMATSMVEGFVSAITGLPGTVSGILQQCISAFKGVVSQAFNAAKDFAKGLWDGFKQGLGIKSPSYIEKAAWQITGVLDAETKKMARKTMEVQAISKKLARTSFTVGDPGAPSSDASYMKLARDQAVNLNRARTLMDASGRREVRPDASTNRNQTPQDKVRMEITNWRTGEGYIYGIAQNAVDDSRYETARHGRMNNG